MCWNGQASAALATLGFGMTVYCVYKGEKPALWIPLFYFTLMELLQAVTYVYLNLCETPQNQMLTLFGYIHIMFQPFFVNMVGLYFIPAVISQRIQSGVYLLCGVCAALFVVKLYPFNWAGLCKVGTEPFCGLSACSYRGSWHIAWQLPLNGILSGNLGAYYYSLHGMSYVISAFVLPVLYGSWRFTLITFLLGPFLSFLLTNTPNEFPAVWCLFSIALCLTIIKSPIRSFLFVKNWILWRWMTPGEIAPIVRTTC